MSDAAATSERSGPARKLLMMLRALGLTLLVLVVFTIAAVAFLISPIGLPVVLSQAKSFVADSGATLITTGESGSLYGGIAFDSIRWTDDATTVSASRITSSWSLASLLSWRLIIKEFIVDRIEIQPPPEPSESQARQAISLPSSLALPIEFALERLQVRELIVRPPGLIGGEALKARPVEGTAAAPLVFRDIGLSFGYRGGDYVIDDIALESPWMSIASGEGRLADTQPYPVTARLSSRGEIARFDFDTEVRLFGDLDLLRVSVDGAAVGSSLSVQATLKPLTLAPVSAANVRLSSVQTTRLSPAVPQALLDVSIRLRTDIDPSVRRKRWRVAADLTNTDVGLSSENRLPVKSLSAVFDFADPTVQPVSDVQISELNAKLLAANGAATIAGDATINLSEQLELAGQTVPIVLASLAIERLDLAPFTSPELQTSLSGMAKLSRDRFALDLKQSQTQLAASGAPGTQIMDTLPGRTSSIQVRGLFTDQVLQFDRASIMVGETTLSASGSVQARAPHELHADASIKSFRLNQWIPQGTALAQRWRDGLINARLTASGPLLPGPSLQLALDVEESQLAGQPLSAAIQAGVSLGDRGQLGQITDLDAKLAFGKNEFTANGSLFQTSAQSSASFTLNLAQMSAINGQIAGRAQLSGGLTGPLDDLRLAVKGGAQRVRFKPAQGPFISVGSVTVDAQLPLNVVKAPDSSVLIDLRARDLRRAGDRIVTLSTRVEGSPRRHRVDTSLNLSGQITSLIASGTADLADQPGWRGTIDSIRSDGRIRIRSASQAGLSATAQSVDLSALKLAISGSGIERSQSSLDRFSLDLTQPPRAHLQGQLQALPVAQLVSAFRSEPLPATLNNLRLSSKFDLEGSGIDDLTGLLTARLSEQGKSDSQLGLAGQNEARFTFDQGTVDGDVDLTLPSLDFTRRFTGPSWVVDGRATLAGTVSGRLTAPRYLVRLSVTELSLLQPALGWRLEQGKLLADISDRGLTLRTLRLQTGDDGKVEMTGQASILDVNQLPDLPDGSRPVLPLDGRFELDTNAFVVPIGPGQQLILSGKTRLLAERGRLRWLGNLIADEGLIEIAGSGAPALPDDVQIISDEPARRAPAKAAARPDEPGQVAVEIALDVNLGERLRVMGGGVNARLTGQLVLLGSLPGSPRAEGLVEIKDGTYQAYSQNLRIRRGDVRFNGPIDNPALNIEAIRPNLPVTAGVSITGLALSPRIDLFADPSMTDAETLSWLVLGVPIDSAQSGAQSLALKEAASRILGQDDGSVSGGSFSDKLGLDTLGFGFASDTGQTLGVRDSGAPTGLPGAGGQTSVSTYQEVVTLGKRLSDRLTVSYEQGVRGLFNLLRIQYEINQRLSLRAQTGSENAVDLLYFWSFD